ncbi:hypothetical protein BDQ17DRAFT_1370004 [Cyathus striatus]|nr:hypothetical protein BDQ17DRAFT_1370004 [Cyathus striatus]
MYRWIMRRLPVLILLVTLTMCDGLLSQLPLLVKSPSLHSWVTAGNVSMPGGIWPTFWNQHILGWSSWIRVDGISYQWTGATISTRPNMTTNTVTPTRTIFTFNAGPVAFNATYLSPINPSDLVQQSLPFGYFYADVWSLDGRPHSIQFYFDATGEILSSDTTQLVQWNTTQTGNVVYHRMSLVSGPSMEVDDGDIDKDCTLIFTMENRPDVTWQTGSADTPLPDGLRATFNAGRTLSNSDDTNYRAIRDDWPVLAFRVDLGNITQTDSSLRVVWSIGIIREPAVQYIQVQHSSYYWSAYNSTDDLVEDVIGKFDDVMSNATDLDNKILADGGAISPNFNDLISLSLRFTFGAMDITLARFPNGTIDTSDVKVFMKDVGTSRRINPVETIYASLPAILYLNTSLVRPLLEPLLEYQNSSDYKNIYAAPDLGNTYPRVQGNTTNTTELALESCSSMLIMVLAHALKSGDGTLISLYYDLLNKWANYLEQNTLHPVTVTYSNSDGESNPNLSNLALKGIMGLYAMSKISEVAGRSNDSSHYQSQAQNYSSQWESLAISSGHITSVYGNTSSWGLIYNLYAAKLLGSNLFSDQIYTQQSQFYASQVDTAPKFGFPYDTNDVGKAKSHWTLFTAAMVTDPSLRDSLVGMVWQRAVLNDTIPFPATYDPNNGNPISGIASPAQGAMFAPLALTLPNRQISGLSPTLSGKGTKVGPIAGGVVAGVLGLLIVVGLMIFFRRKRQILQKNPTMLKSGAAAVEPFSTHAVVENSSVPIPSRINWAIPTSSKSGGRIDVSTSYLSSRGHPSTVGSSVSAPPSAALGAASSSSGPSSDIRTEVEQLRREMEALRSERLMADPPPLYDLNGPSTEDRTGSDREVNSNQQLVTEPLADSLRTRKS